MTIIANPIYDVVFKYLLEDLDIAKGLLSRILDEEIESLEVKSQETIQEMEVLNLPILKLLRLDFKAVIKTQNPLFGTNSKEPEFLYKKILIELQKAKELFDIMRFRKYLAENYGKPDTYINVNGENQTEILPIVSIYFLGFSLEHVPFGVLKVGRCLENVLTKEKVQLKQLDPFIALLTHESYMIQLHSLDKQYQTPLENILMLFNQKFVLKDDAHRLQIEVDIATDILVEKAQKRLLRAASDDEVRKKMDIEDEIERTIISKLKEKEIEIAEKEVIIEQKDKLIAEKNTALAAEKRKNQEKEQALADEKRKNQEKEQALADEKRKNEEKEQALADEKRKNEEKEQALADEKRKNQENARLLAELQAQIDALKNKNV